MIVSLAIAALPACKHAAKPAPPPAPQHQQPTAQPRASTAADPLTEKMRHCPVTLPGVRTETEDSEHGIRFVLRASAPDVVAEAQKRAHELVAFTAGRSKQRHGGGHGGGFMRNCPIVTRDAKVEATDDPDGVTITVTPNDPDDLADLRADARERLARAPLLRANVVREETSAGGETRLYAGAVGDLDGDGTPELVVVGFSAEVAGHRSTILVYRRQGDAWEPVTEGGWDDGAGSTLRDVQIADIDGDGKLDVIVLGRVGATPHSAKGRLAVFDLEAGKLVQRAETEWQHGQYTHGFGLAVGDLDGDHQPEIVTGGFQFDGTTETGFVRVWSMTHDALVSRAETVLDGQGSPSMRVNDLAIGAFDGHPAIVVAGRHGPLKTEQTKEHLDLRREAGDLSILAYAGGKLEIKTRYSWTRGTSLRLRSVVVADLDGDHRPVIVAGGQYDAVGKACLGLFGYEGGKLVLRDDASSTKPGVTGEVKDLIVVGQGANARVISTGVAGDKPGRQGDVAAWRLDRGKLVADGAIVSRNGDETRARAVVVIPGDHGASIITIGHAQTKAGMVGQLLSWQLKLPE